MSTEQLFAMWDALLTLGGDDIRLVLTQTMHGPTLPLSSLVAFPRKNVGEALHRVARFKALCAPEEFVVVIANQGCVISTAWIYAKRLSLMR